MKTRNTVYFATKHELPQVLWKSPNYTFENIEISDFQESTQRELEPCANILLLNDNETHYRVLRSDNHHGDFKVDHVFPAEDLHRFIRQIYLPF